MAREPITVDIHVAAGRPITATTGVRIEAITSRSGYTAPEIEHPRRQLRDTTNTPPATTNTEEMTVA
jgi:hypothetical protein